MSKKGFKEIKVEFIEEKKDECNIAISFNDGRYGVDVKWINKDEAKTLLSDLMGILVLINDEKQYTKIRSLINKQRKHENNKKTNCY